MNKSEPQDASALKGHGLVIIARKFSRIFLRNAVNLGLRLLARPELEIDEGDELRITSG